MTHMGNYEDAEVGRLLEGNTEDVIAFRLEQYRKKMPLLKDREDELEELRKRFVSDFPIRKLMGITKEEYVIGGDRKDTFCFRIENELVGLGNIHGANALKFGLYYGKKGKDTTQKYRFSAKFGETEDEAMGKIREEIVRLLAAGNNDDFDGIRGCLLSPMYRGKILSVYYPEKYFCIFVPEHLIFFMQNLGIQAGTGDDILIQQKKLLDWMQNRPECKGWRVHEFSSFLYDSFGRPFSDEKEKQKEQDERDKAYPTEYAEKVAIKISQWEDMLRNPEIFHKTDIDLMKRFYKSDNHAATCFDLGIEDGVSPSTYIEPVVALARRISDAMDLPPIYNSAGKQVWWRVLFWGRYREDKHFEWKLQPKLARAMAGLFDDLDEDSGMDIENHEDDILVEELRRAKLESKDAGFEYIGRPKEKQIPLFIEGHKTYPRDRQTAIHALAHAGYLCEIDKNHPSFIRRNCDTYYTEPHHLIPMSCSDQFDVSLDVEENIVSLCSNCHNEIHYGRDAAQMVEKLYWERKVSLERAGLIISLDKLLDIYGY